jgi:molybdopterin-guanine dinucleotide biosynthesis protein A
MERRVTLLGGVFVGGRSSRMGHHAKGLLRAPDGRTLVARCVAILRDVGAEVVLVGRAEEYVELDVAVVEDEPPGIGPLGGLVALLHRATGRSVMTLASDMPFVDEALVRRFVEAPAAPIVAARRNGRWEPLCERFDSSLVLGRARAQVADGDHALYRLLDRCGAVELSLPPEEKQKLRDWDTPEDVRRE